MKSIARAIASALFASAVAAGCYRPSQEHAPLRPDQVLDFDKLFRQNCAGCHGADGRLGPAPPLNDALYLSIISDDQMRQVVSKGRAGTPMSPFEQSNGGTLTAAQVDALVAGVRSRWGKAATQPADPFPAYAASSGRRNPNAGAAVYGQICAACHGNEGEGSMRAGRINDRAFLALISDQALRRIVITGRPDLGMPDYRHVAQGTTRPGPLTQQEIDDVVAFVASWRDPPRLSQAAVESGGIP